MGFYESAWWVVAVLFLVVIGMLLTIFIIDKVQALHSQLIASAEEAAIMRYGSNLYSTSHWFSADTSQMALAQAIAKDMEVGSAYPNVSEIRDRHLPTYLAKLK